MLQSLLSLPIMATAAAAATVSVAVGQNGFTYSPSSVTAAVGDIIEYSFFPPNHSVIMGDFNNACMPAATGGFFSGFMTGASSSTSSSSSGGGSSGGGGLGYRQTSAGGSVFQVMINSTDPIFFYCGVPTHCQAGMVGVINPNSSQTLSAYQSKASSSSNTGVPSNVFGGTLVAAGSSGSSTRTGSAAPSSTKGSGSEGMQVSRAVLAVTAASVFVGLLMA